jgi:hypothetical protein
MPQAQRVQPDDNAANENAESKRRPEFSVRHGNVEIAVWRNDGTNGEFLSASIPTIRYRDAAGDWKDGSSFGRHDLLDLAEAARETATKIRDRGIGRTQGQAR